MVMREGHERANLVSRVATGYLVQFRPGVGWGWSAAEAARAGAVPPSRASPAAGPRRVPPRAIPADQRGGRSSLSIKPARSGLAAPQHPVWAALAVARSAATGADPRLCPAAQALAASASRQSRVTTGFCWLGRLASRTTNEKATNTSPGETTSSFSLVSQEILPLRNNPDRIINIYARHPREPKSSIHEKPQTRTHDKPPAMNPRTKISSGTSRNIHLYQTEHATPNDSR